MSNKKFVFSVQTFRKRPTPQPSARPEPVKPGKRSLPDQEVFEGLALDFKTNPLNRAWSARKSVKAYSESQMQAAAGVVSRSLAGNNYLAGRPTTFRFVAMVWP